VTQVVEHRVASAKPRVQLLVLPQKQTKKQKTNSLNAILVVFILIGHGDVGASEGGFAEYALSKPSTMLCGFPASVIMTELGLHFRNRAAWLLG
jgi:hypothetical protein